MPRDKFTVDYLAGEMAKSLRRNPEFRKPRNDTIVHDPFRLVGVLDGHAIVRRKGCALATYALKDFDTWIETDKDGNPLNAD